MIKYTKFIIILILDTQNYLELYILFLGREWPYYDEDGFMDDGENEVRSDDSDFEYEDSWSRSKRTSAGSGRGRGSRGGGRGRGSKDVIIQKIS